MKKLYVLFPAFLLLILASFIQPPKPFTIQGVVEDAWQQPLAGAEIRVEGAKTSALTDKNGAFKLESRDSCLTISITHANYEPLVGQTACAGTTNRFALFVPAPKAEEEKDLALMEIVVAGQAAPSRANAKKSKQPAGVMAPYIPYSSDDAPAMNTENYDVIVDNRFYATNKEPLSTFSIDVDAASYSNLRRFISNGTLPPKDAVRIEEMINYFTYEYPEPKGDVPFETLSEIAACPWQPSHQLLKVALQGKRIPTENLPASNLVFLIDVSGSMDEPNKLPLLKSSFKLLVDQLRPQDKVAVVVYAGAAGLVLPPTSGADKPRIKEAIEDLRAGGSTAGGEGIILAYKTAREHLVKGGNNRVILATDGDFNVGASSDAEMVRLIEKERESGVFLTVLGFGMGNYKDNKMQQLADKGNGNHAYIDNLSEARKVLVNEFGGTLFTIAKDVKIQIEFNPAQVRGYRLLGYENRVLAAEDFNDDKKDAGELGSGHTVTALYEIIPAGVNSPFLASVDDLKYQQTTVKENPSASKEWCTIKLRYKQPAGTESRLLEQVVKSQKQGFDQASADFRWAASVAAFGMLLRDSEYKGSADYRSMIRWAQAASGKDPGGYRAECIRMMENAAAMAGNR